MPPARPQQDGISEGKQNGSQCRQLLGLSNENDPETKARSKGGAPRAGWARGDPVGKLANSRDLLSSAGSYGNRGQTLLRVSLCFVCVCVCVCMHAWAHTCMCVCFVYFNPLLDFSLQELAPLFSVGGGTSP